MGILRNLNPIWITTLVCHLGFSLGVPYEGNMKSYAGYQLLRTEPIHKQELAESLLVFDGKQDNILTFNYFRFCAKNLACKFSGVHFWKYPLVNRSSDILASPAPVSYTHLTLPTILRV